MIRVGDILKTYTRSIRLQAVGVEEDERVDSSGLQGVMEDDYGEHTEESGEPEHLVGERGDEA